MDHVSGGDDVERLDHRGFGQQPLHGLAGRIGVAERESGRICGHFERVGRIDHELAREVVGAGRLEAWLDRIPGQGDHGDVAGLLGGAREAIDALDAAIDRVAVQRTEAAGKVRISSGVAVGHRYVLPLLPLLAARHPKIIPDIVFDDRRVDLVRDGFDIALRGGVLDDSSLISRRVCSLLTVLAASPDYLARHGVPRQPDDLAGHRLIAVRFLTGRTSPWPFRTARGKLEERIPDQAAVIVSDPEAAVETAASGLGVAQVGVHHAWRYLREGRLKLVLAEHHDAGAREMALQYPHRALVAPRVRATVDLLLQELGKVEALQVRPEDLRAYRA